ncbi:MAG TPA: mannose-1-phosphate guanylyltransferase/mannose-6-phosphate isomerase [Methylotenera sp.]
MTKHSHHKIVPVILCGGSGTRLWPLSRAGLPKQFLILTGTTSLFQQAVARVNALASDDIHVGDTLVVTNEEHRFLVLDQLREMPEVAATLLLEPVGRNTAPALTLAALQAIENGEDPILVASPADHAIQDTAAFKQMLQTSIRDAAGGAIVILGVTPNSAATGYGYIKYQSEPNEHGAFRVTNFTEKPDAATAQAYLDSDEYVWNSGMFVLKASTWLKALQQFHPEMMQASLQAFVAKTVDAQFIRPQAESFAAIPADSVDYAVLERCPGSDFAIHMLPLDAGWNDLGVWDSVWQVGNQDQHGNVTLGDTLLSDTSNSLIYAGNRLVSTLGVDNLIVVETADAVLVADRSQSQHVKKLVNTLEALQRNEHELPRKVHRPWGWFDSVDHGSRFKVKRIQVKPGASLSLQKHQHRTEHWIVVKGTAEVTCGDQVYTLIENQSTYIPQGTMHRLKNPGSIPLEIIEVQSGAYLGEDDIVRFDDHYGR